MTSVPRIRLLTVAPWLLGAVTGKEARYFPRLADDEVMKPTGGRCRLVNHSDPVQTTRMVCSHVNKQVSAVYKNNQSQEAKRVKKLNLDV